MKDKVDNNVAGGDSVPLICSTARRIRATVFLSEAEASLLYDFAHGTDSTPELNALCEKLEKMALSCHNRHLQR